MIYTHVRDEDIADKIAARDEQPDEDPTEGLLQALQSLTPEQKKAMAKALLAE